MFTVRFRDNAMGGEVLFEETHPTADAAESAAFRQIIEASDSEPVTIRQDGGFGDGIEDGWGGEFVITAESWGSDVEYRLILETED